MNTIVLHTALHIEARPLMTAFGLVRSQLIDGFDIYEGLPQADLRLLLVVSGPGSMNACTAVAAVLGKIHSSTQYSAPPMVLNIGFAGSNSARAIGSLHLVNKVRDKESQRHFYPDILCAHRLPETSLETFATPVLGKEDLFDPESLVDMEAFGVFHAANPFLPMSCIQSLKIVSDHFSDAFIAKAEAQALMEGVVEDIKTYLHALASYQNSLTPLLNREDQALLSKLQVALSLTKTQTHLLEDYYQGYTVRFGEKPEFVVEYLDASPGSKKERNDQFKAIKDLLCST